MAVRIRVPREALHDALTALAPHLGAERGIVQHALERFGEPGGVVRRDEPRSTVFEEVARAAGVVGDDRDPARHRLHD